MAPSLVAFNIDLRGGAALFVVAPERGAVASLPWWSERDFPAEPLLPARSTPPFSHLASKAASNDLFPPPLPPFHPVPSSLARGRVRACTRERIPLSAALAEGAEDGWMELKTVEQ